MRSFEFDEPTSISDAKARKRRLEIEIADIGRQLSDKTRKRNGKAMGAADYVDWRHRTRNVLLRKEAEQVYLKDWILERRRRLIAQKLDVENVDDPISLLAATRAELLREEPRIGLLVDVIDQFLTHSA